MKNLNEMSTLGHPSPEVSTQKIWKLRKCIYGFTDSSLQWYKKVKTTMLRLKGQVSKIDSSIFYCFDKEGLHGILSVHVDDFLWARSNKFQKDIISKIKSIFEVEKEAISPFINIGLNLSQEEMCILLT